MCSRFGNNKQNFADDGDIVVALVDNQNTLKTFFRDEQNRKIILHPENEQMDNNISVISKILLSDYYKVAIIYPHINHRISASKIAEEVGVSRGTVYKYLVAMNEMQE